MGAAALCALLLLCGCSEKPQGPAEITPSLTTEPVPQETLPAENAGESGISPFIDENIIHGGGTVGKYVCSNSLEAVEAAAGSGCRFIELDFCLTSDGEPVCIHDWNIRYLPEWAKEDFPLTLSDFGSSRIYGELTPLTLHSLNEWLEDTDGVYIILDCKDHLMETLAIIVERYPELTERLIPQIYAEDQLEPVRALGFPRVIYTVYQLPWEDKLDTEQIAAFAKNNALTGVTFPVELTEQEGYVAALLESGIPLYVHTVNDPAVIQELLNMGITSVYTDCY
ncbi:MAG: glycerophosphodiester phosphodiesterase family protein [Eubacteriales bacterium]|nr:glycerophosphodiester phosphodiesterase family protein [Eubacteriales bacterium]